jgi:predicted nucleic acid-binding protein
MVDCANFVVMADLGIRDAFTSDRHFEQAGFRCLLPGPDGRGGTSNGPAR